MACTGSGGGGGHQVHDLSEEAAQIALLLGAAPLAPLPVWSDAPPAETLAPKPGSVAVQATLQEALDAMESTEVQPYIEHRLKCVGWEGNPSFDDRVFGEIYTASRGIPRRIKPPPFPRVKKLARGTIHTADFVSFRFMG